MQVVGRLDGENMPFTIDIQTLWQQHMIAKHNNRGGVSIDATFGIDQKNVSITFKITYHIYITILNLQNWGDNKFYICCNFEL